MSFFISDAFAAVAATTATPTNGMPSLLLMVGFLIIFYLMLWRPQAKRAKEQRALISNLAKGDEVITSGGLVGKITKITDDFVELMIAEGVEIKLQKPAVIALVPKGTIKN